MLNDGDQSGLSLVRGSAGHRSDSSGRDGRGYDA